MKTAGQKMTGRTLYDIAAQVLMHNGVRRVEEAYSFFPDMHPRTVRRVWERATVLMEMLMDGETTPAPPTSLHLDSTELERLTAQASEAKVNLKAAVTAVLRFANPLERVTRVLTDIRALAQLGTPARNPSGLFVRLMRSGENVRLPMRAEAEREEKAAETAKRPPLKVGDWIKWNFEWVRVMTTNGLHAMLSPTGDEFDIYKVNVDAVAHLPRCAHPAGCP